jgi:hypothetical protein
MISGAGVRTREEEIMLTDLLRCIAFIEEVADQRDAQEGGVAYCLYPQRRVTTEVNKPLTNLILSN